MSREEFLPDICSLHLYKFIFKVLFVSRTLILNILHLKTLLVS